MRFFSMVGYFEEDLWDPAFSGGNRKSGRRTRKGGIVFQLMARWHMANIFTVSPQISSRVFEISPSGGTVFFNFCCWLIPD
jgi:hypothetical protein